MSIKCIRCNKLMNPTWKFCPHCGIKLRHESEYEENVWIDGYYVGSGI